MTVHYEGFFFAAKTEHSKRVILKSAISAYSAIDRC